MRYYIADLHFYHEAVNHRMDCRGFSDVEQMNRHMIACWNWKVRKNDDVIILGDFSMGDAKQTNEILEQLNGNLFLIKGNHEKYLTYRHFDASRFGWIADYKELHDNKRKVILCHYPIFCYNGQYRLDEENNAKTYMLYGHVHNTYDEVLLNQFILSTRHQTRNIFNRDEPVSIPCNMINCFCMFSNYEPLTLDEWIAVDEKRRQMLVMDGNCVGI